MLVLMQLVRLFELIYKLFIYLNNIPSMESTNDNNLNLLQRFSIGKSKRKPCCVCKQTKKYRDSCLRNNDEDICFDFIAAHKMCLQAKGFRV